MRTFPPLVIRGRKDLPVLADMPVTAWDQLSASPVEPFAQAMMAEIMAKGWSRANQLNWNDCAIGAWSPDAARYVGVIVWRRIVHMRSAYVSMGAVHPDYRQRGVYQGLWCRFAGYLATDFAEVAFIESGYHVENEASAAMHRKLGRKVEGVFTSFDLEAHRRECAIEGTTLKPPPGCVFLSGGDDA